jgi:hypothetical protein
MSDETTRSSLDELAGLFEVRARAARDAIKPTTVNMRIALLRERASVWEEAARIVRASIAAEPTPATGRLKKS